MRRDPGLVQESRRISRASGVFTISGLLALNLISENEISVLRGVVARYPVRITPHLTRLMDGKDSKCPLRRQFVPVQEEMESGGAGYSDDPLCEARYMPVSGLVHRYPDRILIHVSSECAALCRFCFRKSLLRQRETALEGDNWSRAMAYLARAGETKEVILSGGDPLMLPDEVLNEVMHDLSGLSPLRNIRIHSRVPLVSPDRVTTRLTDMLSRHPALRMVVHVNHPAELVPDSLEALERLDRAGVSLLSQSVLLRGVNDQVDILAELFRVLRRHSVRPYYLHHPDPAEGTSHFAVSLFEGLQLYRALRLKMDSTLLPCYVVDLPETGRKTPVESLFGKGGSSLGHAGPVVSW